ncbi:hypothetical protein JHW43_006262 [Diplocarpon mali]|nr:hypothetical protein JHW43_006262 [Diplocarpon mali]
MRRAIADTGALMPLRMTQAPSLPSRPEGRGGEGRAWEWAGHGKGMGRAWQRAWQRATGRVIRLDVKLRVARPPDAEQLCQGEPEPLVMPSSRPISGRANSCAQGRAGQGSRKKGGRGDDAQVLPYGVPVEVEVEVDGESESGRCIEGTQAYILVPTQTECNRPGATDRMRLGPSLSRAARARPSPRQDSHHDFTAGTLQPITEHLEGGTPSHVQAHSIPFSLSSHVSPSVSSSSYSLPIKPSPHIQPVAPPPPGSGSGDVLGQSTSHQQAHAIVTHTIYTAHSGEAKGT